MKFYRVLVMDPLKPRDMAEYTVSAFNEGHAKKQGLDGHTGLFGNYQETQERLKVKVQEA